MTRPTLKDKAAEVLDRTHNAAALRVGIYTDKVRDHLAAWLDGAVKLRASTVRREIDYLAMIARSARP